MCCYSDDFERDLGPGIRFTGDYTGAGTEGRGVQMGGSKISPHVFLLGRDVQFMAFRFVLSCLVLSCLALPCLALHCIALI